MNQIFVLIKKDLLNLSSNKKAYLKTIIFPLIILIITSVLYFFSNIKDKQKFINIEIENQTLFKISKSNFPGYFNIKLSNKKEIFSKLKNKKIDIGIVFLKSTNKFNTNLIKDKFYFNNKIYYLKKYYKNNYIKNYFNYKNNKNILYINFYYNNNFDKYIILTSIEILKFIISYNLNYHESKYVPLYNINDKDKMFQYTLKKERVKISDFKSISLTKTKFLDTNIIFLNPRNKKDKLYKFILIIFYFLLLILMRINNPNTILLTYDELENKTINILKILPIKNIQIIFAKVFVNFTSLALYIFLIFILLFPLYTLVILKIDSFSFIYILLFLKIFIIFLFYSIIYSFIQIFLGFNAKNTSQANRYLTIYPFAFFIFFTLYFSLSLLSKNNISPIVLKYIFYYTPFINIFFFGINFLFNKLTFVYILIFMIENILFCIFLFFLTVNNIKKEKILF